MKFSLKNSIKWSVFISIVTFMLAAIISLSSHTVLEGINWILGMLIVLLLILIGVTFDVLGLASAAANETPFHAMAAKKIKGSKQAIMVVRNADRFSNFCNDVIGDITGIVSGTASAVVVIKMIGSINASNFAFQTSLTVLFAALVSALTVGGKAIGKSIAISYATEIILVIGKVLYFFEKRFRIRLFQGKPKSINGKRGN